jgi:PBP1b-binding outer membrane lipoprotein LpoB
MRKYSVILLVILSILLAGCAQQEAHAEQVIVVSKTTLTQKSQNLTNIDPEINQSTQRLNPPAHYAPVPLHWPAQPRSPRSRQ